ncbi:hypothetical protein FSC17_10675 [Acinetobacter indicus]|nr:hypothetical protein FSC17_10675 [Acinetobacter indicus]
MTFHWFVDVERVHARSIEASQPHITNNHELQLVIIVLHTISQNLTLLLGRMVLGNFFTIRSR